MKNKKQPELPKPAVILTEQEKRWQQEFENERVKVVSHVAPVSYPEPTPARGDRGRLAEAAGLVATAELAKAAGPSSVNSLRTGAGGVKFMRAGDRGISVISDGNIHGETDSWVVPWSNVTWFRHVK